MIAQKSLFLDFIRITAALVVLYGHAVLLFFGDTDSDPFLISNMRHFAVVLFFVLSGYVIGFTTKVNNRGVMQYAVARLSRLCSMVIPALVISFLVECTINYITYKNFYLGVANTVRYLITAIFMNEFWFYSSAPRINVPLWSISFEFFFYLIFGVFLFTKGKIKKRFYTAAACLFAGPKILVMFPIWIAGYLAYIFNDRVRQFKNYFLFLFFLMLTYVSYLYIDPYPFLIGEKPFYFANQFVTDFIIGVLFSLSVLFFPEHTKFKISPKFIKSFRKIADYTFPIYILHYPIIELCKVVFNGKLEIHYQFYLAIGISLFCAISLGEIFERRRPIWASFFKNILEKRIIKDAIYKL